jgi:thiosulfate reductase cytochrome b subunit
METFLLVNQLAVFLIYESFKQKISRRMPACQIAARRSRDNDVHISFHIR